MKVTMKFEGARDLERALGQIVSAATRKNVARRALKAAAEPILSRYRAGTTVASGDLVESEIVGTKLNKRQTRLNRAQKMPVEVHIGTADPAGLIEEFGLHNQAANPALRQAWDAEGDQAALDRIGDVLGKEIDKAAKRQARKAAKAKG